jgi:hypothetical protein
MNKKKKQSSQDLSSVENLNPEPEKRKPTLEEICRKYSAYSPPYDNRSWSEMIDDMKRKG